MIEGIIDAVKGEVVDALTSKLNLEGTQIDSVLNSSQEAVEKTVSEEASSNGIDTLLNLFSEKDNNDSANSLLSSLGGNLLSSLGNNGFDSGTSSQIKDIVLPLVMSFISKKVGGDSSNLTGLLGGLLGGASNNKGGDLLGKVGGSLLKGLFK